MTPRPAPALDNYPNRAPAGEGFRNVHPILPGLRDPNATLPTWTDFLCNTGRRVPARPLPSVNPLEAWRRPPESGLRTTWLGHSTVLIEIDGVRVLTDPSYRAQLAARSRVAHEKYFSWQAIAASYAEQLKKSSLDASDLPAERFD